MTPVPFSKLEFTLITLDTPTGSIEGLFSEQRPDIATIPDGLTPYYIRSSGDDDSVPATIETRVAVDYFGVIVVDKPLDFGGSGYIEILDWNFDDGPDNCPEWAREYLKRAKGRFAIVNDLRYPYHGTAQTGERRGLGTGCPRLCEGRARTRVKR